MSRLLWRNIQTWIQHDNRDQLRQLIQTQPKEMIRVILTFTMTIDHDRLSRVFGKLTDLNALQMALVYQHEHISYMLLQLFKHSAFWGHVRLVRLLLELGADPYVLNVRQLRPIDCTTHPDILSQLKRPSFLLEKAALYEEHVVRIMSPISFSSSSSTSTCSTSSWSPSTPIQKKKVRFHPAAVIMDACVCGDVREVMDHTHLVDISHIKDTQHRSLLHLTIMNGHEELFISLIQLNKIDVNQRDMDGKCWTCLHYAAALGLWKSLEYLSSLPECNLNARTHLGLRAQDCPESESNRRRCRLIIDKSNRQRK
ncbi:ankyrin repeat-containing domain protein [Pilobolus umbonatus]|nr:ankyrin repeat-containing domain protein [Pilobolus umbonatus]